MPVNAVLDGELVAFNEDGPPWFPDVCRRLLHGDGSVSIVYMVFDVLAVDGESTMELPYRKRRELLESLRLDGPWWRTPDVFKDGQALVDAACDHGARGRGC